MRHFSQCSQPCICWGEHLICTWWHLYFIYETSVLSLQKRSEWSPWLTNGRGTPPWCLPASPHSAIYAIVKNRHDTLKSEEFNIRREKFSMIILCKAIKLSCFCFCDLSLFKVAFAKYQIGLLQVRSGQDENEAFVCALLLMASNNEICWRSWLHEWIYLLETLHHHANMPEGPKKLKQATTI